MNKFIKVIFFVLYAFLVLFQIKTTNVELAYSFSAKEIDLAKHRLNQYPPQISHLAYYWEEKKEVQILRKLEDNFFTVLDFREYFDERIHYAFAPLIFSGLYFLFRDRKKYTFVVVGLLVSICILTILGPYAIHGPVLMYPFFVFVSLLSIKELLKRK